MVKNSDKVSNTPETKDSNKAGNMHIALFLLLGLIIVGSAGLFLYHNPQLLKSVPEVQKDNTEILQLKNRITELQQKLEILERETAGKISGRELNALNERIDTHARLNKEILDSKAGNNAILGLINRVDILETKVQNLGKVSNKSALILTAAMLVKDSAENKRNFEYEAEILRQLAHETNMQPAAEVIASISIAGLPTKNQLIEDFNSLYQKYASEIIVQPEENSGKEQEFENTTPNWKDKINEQIGKFITFKHSTKEGELVETKLPEDEIYVLVNNGQLDEAVMKMKDNPHYQTEDFNRWKNKISLQETFYKALRRILATTLASMKVENLQNNAE